MLHVIVIILTVIVSVLLIGIVLIQKSKGGGLSSQFGGANSLVGVRQTNNFLEKGTWWLAGIIVFLSICSAYTMPKMGNQVEIMSEKQAPAATAGANQFDTQAPAAGQTATEAPALPVNVEPAADTNGGN